MNGGHAGLPTSSRHPLPLIFLPESTATHRAPGRHAGASRTHRVHPSDPGALSNVGRRAESQGRRLPEYPPAHACTLYWWGALTHTHTRTHPTCELRLSEPDCLCGSALGYQIGAPWADAPGHYQIHHRLSSGVRAAPPPPAQVRAECQLGGDDRRARSLHHGSAIGPEHLRASEAGGMGARRRVPRIRGVGCPRRYRRAVA